MSSLEISCWILLLFVFSRNVVKKSVYFCFFFTKMTSNFGGNPEETPGRVFNSKVSAFSI